MEHGGGGPWQVFANKCTISAGLRSDVTVSARKKHYECNTPFLKDSPRETS